MSKTSTFNVPFRRRKEGRTNYYKRLAMVKSVNPRAVIRKSTNHLLIQLVQTEHGKDSVIASAHTQELGGFDYKGHGGNIPAAYLVGYLLGKRMIEQKKNVETIVDLGVQPPVHGTRLFAAVKGLVDAGINVKADPISFPKEDRLKGKHVEAFAKKEPSKMNRSQFGSYVKKSISTEGFSNMVEASKKTIDGRVKA